MCGTAVKLSNSKEVPEKYCQVVAENCVQNPTVKMSYETINTEGRLQSRQTRAQGEMVTQQSRLKHELTEH